MKKIITVFVSVSLIFCICGCSTGKYLWYNIENAPAEVFIGQYDNGDSFYTPEGAHIAYDYSSVLYYNNLLITYTDGDLSEEDINRLADTVNGEAVGVVSGGLHCVQIRVENCSLNELKLKADTLMKIENVIYACPEYPVQIMSAEYEDDDYVHDINLWWQDVISLDIAWSYSDMCSEINVGVVDTGYNIEHHEFGDKINIIGDNNSNIDEHGNHVLGIMAAENDEEGIRGIADSAEYYCVDLWHDSSNEDSFHTIGELMAAYNYMAMNNVRVVNNSWGCYIFDKKYYNSLVFANTMKYKDWLENRVNEELIPTAEASIVMIAQLLEAGYDEIIFVQAAGNGYYPSCKPVDAQTGGFFCSINEHIYENIPASAKAYLDENKITYDLVDDRTIIVGASSEFVDTNGFFLPADFSNFGDNIDIFAPGENIYSCVSPEAGSYQYMSGTSMAAPMVTGAVAFIWSLAPEMTASEVKELITNSTLNRVCYQIDGTQYEYPLLDIGFAAETLMHNNISR